MSVTYTPRSLRFVSCCGPYNAPYRPNSATSAAADATEEHVKLIIEGVRLLRCLTFVYALVHVLPSLIPSSFASPSSTFSSESDIPDINSTSSHSDSSPSKKPPSKPVGVVAGPGAVAAAADASATGSSTPGISTSSSASSPSSASDTRSKAESARSPPYAVSSACPPPRRAALFIAMIVSLRCRPGVKRARAGVSWRVATLKARSQPTLVTCTANTCTASGCNSLTTSPPPLPSIHSIFIRPHHVLGHIGHPRHGRKCSDQLVQRRTTSTLLLARPREQGVQHASADLWESTSAECRRSVAWAEQICKLTQWRVQPWLPTFQNRFNFLVRLCWQCGLCAFTNLGHMLGDNSPHKCPT